MTHCVLLVVDPYFSLPFSFLMQERMLRWVCRCFWEPVLRLSLLLQGGTMERKLHPSSYRGVAEVLSCCTDWWCHMNRDHLGLTSGGLGVPSESCMVWCPETAVRGTWWAASAVWGCGRAHSSASQTFSGGWPWCLLHPGKPVEQQPGAQRVLGKKRHSQRKLTRKVSRP
jgi:hypothetical protein